jgi:predicted enzyme related to lactoylglutathione lyase
LTSPVTHFEIYGEQPAALSEFYRQLFGWRLERAPGVDYWRIETEASPGRGIAGGLTHRPIAGTRG